MSVLEGTDADTSHARSILAGKGAQPVTFDKWIQTNITDADGNNDLRSILARLNAGRDPSIETYATLPDALAHPLGRVIYVTGGNFFRNTEASTTTDGEFRAATTGDDIGYSLGAPGVVVPNLGAAVNNPNNRFHFVVESPALVNGVPSTSRRALWVAIDQTIFETALGRAGTTADQFYITITSTVDTNLTEDIVCTYRDEISYSYQHNGQLEEHHMVWLEGPDAASTVLSRLTGDKGFTIKVRNGSQSTDPDLFTGEDDHAWTNINGEVFGTMTTRLSALEDKADKASLTALSDFPDPEDYDKGRIIVVHGRTQILRVTDEDAPNLFEFTIGHDTLRTTGGELWRGISNRSHPNGFATDGGWTANPGGAASFILASSMRHLRFAIKKSSYEAAKGSAFATTDKVAIEVTYADSGNVDTAVGAYFNTYTVLENNADVDYIEFQHRAAEADGNYHLYTEAEGQDSTAEYFTVDSDGNATTTPFLTHLAAVKHWAEWIGDGDTVHVAAEAYALAVANQAKLDALEHAASGAEPTMTWTGDEDTITPLSHTDFHHDFSGVNGTDLIVMTWANFRLFSGNYAHQVAGSADAAGKMYFRASDVQTTRLHGTFIGKSIGFNRLASDDSDDTLGSRAELDFTYTGTRLRVEIAIDTSGNANDQALKVAANFSIKLDIYRGASPDDIFGTSLVRGSGVTNFVYLASAAAFAAITPDSETVYLVDGADAVARSVYLGNKKFA